MMKVIILDKRAYPTRKAVKKAYPTAEIKSWTTHYWDVILNANSPAWLQAVKSRRGITTDPKGLRKRGAESAPRNGKHPAKRQPVKG